MLLQPDNYGFSVPVVFRSKAPCAGKAQSTRFARGAGPGRTLVKHGTKSRRPEATRLTAGHHRNALRVRLSRSTDCVSPLGNGAAITCEVRPANLDKQTELEIVGLQEH